MTSTVMSETTSPAAGAFYGESGSSPPVDRAVPGISVSSIPEPATCRRGHDRTVTGRNARGECLKCVASQRRRYRGPGGPGHELRLAEKKRYRRSEAGKEAHRRQKAARRARLKAAAAARIGAL